MATTSSQVVDTPLIEATFSLDELPSGEKGVLYYRLTLPPGAHLPYLAGPYCGCHDETVTKGVGAEVVQAGTYTVRLDVPVRVHRAGTTELGEVIPSEMVATLMAGDAVLYPDYAASGDLRNTGDGPVTVIGVAIIATAGSGTPLPPIPPGVDAMLLTESIVSDWIGIPPGPLHVAVHQVTLPPETQIGPYQPTGLQALYVASGAIRRSFVSPGDTAPSTPIVQQAGSTTDFVSPSNGVREILASSDEQAAQVTVLIIEPVVSSTSTLAS